jgi:hypothetical protein
MRSTSFILVVQPIIPSKDSSQIAMAWFTNIYSA